MNFLGYTSTTTLNEKQALVEKLLDANTQFHKANGSLKTHVARLKQEIEGLKKTNFGLGKTLDEKNTTLDRQISEFKKISKVFKERGVVMERYKKDIREKNGEIDELNDRVDELTATLKQTNERYDAFVTVSGTNFAHHFERVLKKRKVAELTLD